MDVPGFRTAALLAGALILLTAARLPAAVTQSASRSGEILAQQGTTESEESGDQNIRDFRLKVLNLLSQQKFSDLNTLADQLRTQKLARIACGNGCSLAGPYRDAQTVDSE